MSWDANNKIGSVPSHTLAAVGSDGTEPTTRPRPDYPNAPYRPGAHHDDPLAAARGCAHGILLSIPFWIAAALGAIAAWRWLG